ncbi:PIF1-like helicase domain-containing protein [Hirsutella rhossiliensis]|uniref:ATP-dependent DNA helicase n=1 Tax=Hirsutella rhossiliensis TaxID=111463 RepID=A0A9P8MRD4_9HYPO|nr:PIF1-like helicase domain-containing protein [Hirsutella rhossiliensis]KAH0959769.1 PIF1-like helicase domain-containing protein [Hirsutella rhossiliensis]
MFALDGPPDVADVDKLRFACDAVREGAGDDGGAGPRTWVETSARGQPGHADGSEPYIGVRRGDDFADSFEASFSRRPSHAVAIWRRGTADIREREAATRELVSSRNMSLRTWADTVLRRHGGRFATHHIFAFLVFNIGVRSRNRRVSMLSVTRKNFRKVERIVRSLTADGLAAARAELESTGKTTDDAVKELLRSLSLYGVRARDPEAAEEFLRSLDKAFKRVRLSVSDPMSSAVFFHREMTLFFEHYVNAGGESVFGRVSQYYGAVETNERGSLHVHGLLWLEGNAHLSSMLADSDGGEQAAYRERIVRYVDSVFSEVRNGPDQEGFCAVEAERSVTSDISSLLNRADQFSASFEEEANFCAGATQIHTHSPTCVKHRGAGRGDDPVSGRRAADPQNTSHGEPVEQGHRRRARHNHDISFIATQRKTMALVYYVTNYATKVEDPTWKRVAAAAELLPVVSAGSQPGAGDDFLARVANRVFTERALSQVEVVAHLLGHPSEFSGSSAWAYLNVSVLYWHVSRLWRHLRQQSGTAAVEDVSVADESVVVEQAGERISFAEAYHHRGHVLRGLCLYDYVSLVRLQRVGKAGCSGGWGEYAVVCLDGYLSKDFEQDDEESAHRRAAVQHLALFVPWKPFSAKKKGTSMRYGGGRESCFRRESRASSTTFNCSGDHGGSRELGMIQQLCRFQQSALASTAELEASIVRNGAEAHRLAGAGLFRGRGAAGPGQGHQVAADERLEGEVKMIQGIQSMATAHGTDRGAAERSVLTGFGEEGVQITAAEAEETAGNAEAGMEVRLGPSTSFLEAGKGLTRRLTLNRKQAIALSIICRHLDLMRRGDGGGDVSQLCQFVGGEGGTGKSRVIEALVGLFAAKGISSRLLITATSGTAAARVNGITIHSACGFTKDQGPGANTAREVDGVRLPRQAERFVDGESRMDWQDKEVLVIDEVSMLGARTLHAVNERLCQLRGSQRDFGGIPIVLFCGDFHQFRPVQERSILLPSSAVSWDEDYSFRAEQRHQHDKAHALWKRFTTVVMLDEQMRAAGDPELQRLLKRIRLGVQDHTDLDLLNSRCYREGRRIPWETGITVVTPLNRNRWNLNMEASLAFQMQRRLTIRIFISEHKWKEGLPTEEEAIMMLNQGDDSATPVPGVFIYTAAEVIVDKVHPAHRISADMAIHSAAGGDHTRKEVTRKGLPCAAAFACTDYKVQGGTLERVALELRGTRTTNVGGHGIMLISENRPEALRWLGDDFEYA